MSETLAAAQELERRYLGIEIDPPLPDRERLLIAEDCREFPAGMRDAA